MKLRLLLIFVGFVFLVGVLFVRTTGIHIDENNYLRLAVESWQGDTYSTGKPVLFYWMNNKLHNEVARSMGPFEPVTTYLFYIAAFAASLAWALTPLFADSPRRMAVAYFVLLISPLGLLNATELMMETALLSAVSLLLGAVLRGIDRYWKWIRLFLLSALVGALKATAAPVVALLALLVVRKSKTAVATLFTGALAGYLINVAVLRWIVKSAHSDNYGGPTEILNIHAVVERLSANIRQDLWVWLFFEGIVALAAVLFWVTRKRSEKKPSIQTGVLLTLALGSLPAMLSIQAISIHGFARYTYPVLWLGLVCSIVLIAHSRLIALFPLAAFFIFQSSSLWGQDLDRFSFWPNKTVLEFMESGGTILAGAPVHRLAVEQRLRDPAPCFSVGVMDMYERGYYLQYLGFVFPQGRLVDANESCATHIRIWREPADSVGECPARCGASTYWSACRYQRLRFFASYQGLVLNQFCW